MHKHHSKLDPKIIKYGLFVLAIITGFLITLILVLLVGALQPQRWAMQLAFIGAWAIAAYVMFKITEKRFL